MIPASFFLKLHGLKKRKPKQGPTEVATVFKVASAAYSNGYNEGFKEGYEQGKKHVSSRKQPKT